MSAYKIPITTAFIFFPIIAFFFTLPYLIYQYRKYGSIPLLRSIIIYSFILYLLCTYFLVILPLPSIEEVKKLTTPATQLIPFHFIKELSTISFDWGNLSSYINLLQNKIFYIAGFNILLTIPFGIYLRYYFECKWYQVFLFGFLLSLFFEVTQLTGLYGIYPRAYRLFDVDDLILNTAGAMLGFFLTPLFFLVLPSRKELDEKSFKKGKKVTLFRRGLSYCIDTFFLTIIIGTISILLSNTPLGKNALLIAICLYYLGIPLITNGQTLGKMILKIKVVAKENTKYKKIRIELRYFLSYILFYYQFVIINMLKDISMNNNNWTAIINSSIFVLRVYFCLNVLSIIFSLLKKKKEFLYEKITKTETKSTIEYIEQEDTIVNEQEENNVRIKEDK